MTNELLQRIAVAQEALALRAALDHYDKGQPGPTFTDLTEAYTERLSQIVDIGVDPKPQEYNIFAHALETGQDGYTVRAVDERGEQSQESVFVPKPESPGNSGPRPRCKSCNREMGTPHLPECPMDGGFVQGNQC